MNNANPRISALEAVRYNTGLLPADAVEIDLLSDSWLHKDTKALAEDGEAPGPSLAEALAEHYPYAHRFPVARGRYAEGIFAAALELTAKTVLTNAPFPTTAFHLESRGATLKSISVPEARRPFDPHPFKGNIDLDTLATCLDQGEVEAVIVECCVNALGGHPIALGNLQDAHALTSQHGVPLYLDGTRLVTNAYMIQQREVGLADRPLKQIADDLYRASDGCVASLAKDLVTPAGGIIAVNDEALATRLGDLVHIMWGDGLTAADKDEISRILKNAALNEERVRHRAELSRKLHTALTAAEVPVTQPWGGPGVYVDAATFFPHLTDEHHPAETLAVELFVECGLRTAPNMWGMSPPPELRHLIRLALPLCCDVENSIAEITEGFRAVAKRREHVRGLTVTARPPGILGEYLQQYAPR